MPLARRSLFADAPALSALAGLLVTSLCSVPMTGCSDSEPAGLPTWGQAQQDTSGRLFDVGRSAPDAGVVAADPDVSDGVSPADGSWTIGGADGAAFFEVEDAADGAADGSDDVGGDAAEVAALDAGPGCQTDTLSSCQTKTPTGTCPGSQACTEQGLGPCLPAPVSETCNGVDDDCDGQVDELTCTDDTVCTKSTCKPESGCAVTFEDGEFCDADGDPCTVGDHCKGGLCVPGAGIPCNDGNACTTDACKAGGGCGHDGSKLNGEFCNADSSVCTVADACQDGVCKAGSALPCADGNGCTVDGCDPADGCTNTDASGPPCDDSDPCTVSDACNKGACTGGIPKNCDDTNPCTKNACMAGKCTTELLPNQTPCGDDRWCYFGLCSCKTGLKQGPKGCIDVNECTTGKHDCGPKAICTNLPGSFSCACPAGMMGDGKTCTAAPKCSKCGVNTKCVDKGGSYNCVCLLGFEVTGDAVCPLGEPLKACYEAVAAGKKSDDCITSFAKPDAACMSCINNKKKYWYACDPDPGKRCRALSVPDDGKCADSVYASNYVTVGQKTKACAKKASYKYAYLHLPVGKKIDAKCEACIWLATPISDGPIKPWEPIPKPQCGAPCCKVSAGKAVDPKTCKSVKVYAPTGGCAGGFKTWCLKKD